MASNGGTEPDAGCDVAPQKWGHDSTEALVERVRLFITYKRPIGADVMATEADAALTELAERLKAAERDVPVIHREQVARRAAEAQRDELVAALERAQRYLRDSAYLVGASGVLEEVNAVLAKVRDG